MKDLIKKLASKYLIHGCIVCADYECPDCGDGLQEPIYIGDVMKAIKRKAKFYGDYMVGLDGSIYHSRNGEEPYLEVAKWPDTTKSLQEIAECGYEDWCGVCVFTMEECKDTEACWYEERLKDPSARNLEEFITSIL